MVGARARSGRGGSWLLVGLAAAPLLAAVLLLQFMGPSAAPLTEHELSWLRTLAARAFLPGQITFLAVVAVHLFACVAALFVAGEMLRRTPRSLPFSRAGLGLTIALLVLLPAALAWSPGKAGFLTHGVYARFFDATGAAPAFAEPLFAGISPLDLAIVLPTAFGIAAVAMMSAAANAQLRLFRDILASRAERQAARIRQVHDRLKRCLYALGIVLVTSTVAASLFFHLPAQLPVQAKSVEAELLARFSGFASELSVFWGCIFTLTLAAAVGLPMLLLQSRVRRALEPPPLGGTPDPRRRLLAESGILAEGREQLKFLTALLAPLAAGPMSNLVQRAAAF